MKARLRSVRLLGAVLVMALVGAGCAGSRDERPMPKLVSSASSLGYALGYSDELRMMNQRFATQSEVAKQAMGTFSTFPAALQKTDATQVRDIYKVADEAGYSDAMAARLRENIQINDFIEASTDEIARRVALNANAQVKKECGDCEVNTAGAVHYAFQQATKRELDTRYHQANEAYRLIDLYRDTLDKKSATALEEQVDAITFTSFVVHVELIELRNRIEDRSKDAEAVSKTLDAAIADEEGRASDGNLSKSERKAAEERVKQLRESRGPVEGVAEDSKRLLKEFDEQLEAITKAYDEAFEGLLSATEQSVAAQ